MPRDRRVVLEQDVSAVEWGEWTPTAGFDEGILHVFGVVAGDVVQVEGSNEEGTPANAVQLGEDITADDLVRLVGLPDQIRVGVVDATGGGTVTAILSGTDR